MYENMFKFLDYSGAVKHIESLDIIEPGKLYS